jgi:hypothetical protein
VRDVKRLLKTPYGRVSAGFVAAFLTVNLGKPTSLPTLYIQNLPITEVFSGFQLWLVRASAVLCGLVIVTIVITMF